MKKFTTILLVLMLTAFAAFSAETSRFSGNELSVSLGTGYALDNGFKNPYNFNLNAGVSYYLTRNIGVEAELPFFPD
jgi:opacity protein-like surface antigen